MPAPKRVCRLCLEKNPTIDIFTNDFSIRNKIVECCGVNAYEQDGLPQKICNACLEIINNIVDFKLKCQKSDIRLREQFHSPLTLHHVKKLERISFKNEDYFKFFHSVSDFKPEKYFKDQLKDETGNFSSVQNDDPTIMDSDIDSSANPVRKPKKKKIIRRIKKDSKLCPKCGVVINGCFHSHYRIHFKSTDSYVCDICKKVYGNKYRLGRHIATHGERKFPCNSCGKLFYTMCDAKKHIKNVHFDSFVQCHICNKNIRKSALRVHLFGHTGEKRYQCDICQRKCATKAGLAGHIRIHTGEKPFKCKFCGTHFRDRKALIEHERLHTGETPYECAVCLRGYVQLSNLKSHFKNNHKGVEFGFRRRKYAKNK